ncbi:MAG: hypothetical protein ACYSW4_03090 [Planctomycetota bacterium]|jgi:hypothetical protein
MKTRKLAVLLAAIILVAAAIGQEPEKQPQAALSNTWKASCLVKVTCDPAILPLSLETIDSLMHSSGVAGKAAAEVLGPRDEPYEYDEWFSIEPLDPHSAGRPGRPYGGGVSLGTPYGGGVSQGTPYGGVSEPDELDEQAIKQKGMRGRSAKFQPARGSQIQKQSPEERRGPRRPTKAGKIVRSQRLTAKKPASRWTAAAEQTLLFRLEVDLEDREVKPAAEEFMNAIISNLRQRLTEAYYAYRNKLGHEAGQADQARRNAESELSVAMGPMGDTDADHRTREQLQNDVDLSSLSPQMSFGDAIEILKQSVDPPLPIVVLWHDLAGHASIDQATGIGMDPLPRIQVGKALELLVKSLSSARGIQLGYEIDRGVITIATRENLPTPERKFSQITQMDIPIENLINRKNDLLRDKQHLEINIASSEARWPAIEEQIARINKEITAKAKADPISLELQRLVDLNVRQLERAKKALDSGKSVTGVDVVTEKIARAKIDLAKRREELSRSDGGEQLAKLSRRLTELMIELPVKKAELRVISRQLEETEQQLKTTGAFDPQVSQIRLAKEALEVAQHRLNELKTRLVDLSEPTVTVLGGI